MKNHRHAKKFDNHQLHMKQHSSANWIQQLSIKIPGPICGDSY